MNEQLADSVATGLSLSRYYNASQLRIDTWQRLDDYSARLAENHNRSDTAAIRLAITEALSILEPIVMYWAFPGKDGFLQVRRLFEAGDNTTLALLVARILRALINESYRRKQIELTPEP